MVFLAWVMVSWLAPVAVWVVILMASLLVTGIVLIVSGIRGRAVFSEPRCRKCGYDLRFLDFRTDDARRCPECGADLNAREAVSFGKYQRRPRLIVAGVVMILLVFALPVGFRMFLATPMAVRVAGPASSNWSNAAVLTSLPTRVNTPWDWQELERRLTAGKLSQAEVDRALSILIADLKQQRVMKKPREPLPWSGQFVSQAIMSKAASPAKISEICQTYYDDPPQAVMSSALRTGEAIKCELNCRDNPWNINMLQTAWALKSITGDAGKSLTAVDPYNGNSRGPDQFSGTRNNGANLEIPQNLSPGVHELTFNFDIGVVPENATMRGVDGKPGPMSKWPTPLATWQVAVKQKVLIVRKSDSLVALVTDAQRDPTVTNRPVVREALVRPASHGKQLVIKWESPTYPQLVMSYKVVAIAGNLRIPYGEFVVGQTAKEGSLSSMTEQCTFTGALPAEVKSIDLVFTPDAKVAEQFIGIDEIWGKEMRINGVKLERFDLGG